MILEDLLMVLSCLSLHSLWKVTLGTILCRQGSVVGQMLRGGGREPVKETS